MLAPWSVETGSGPIEETGVSLVENGGSRKFALGHAHGSRATQFDGSKPGPGRPYNSKHVRAIVAELTAALDHKPSAFERALIQQLAAVLWLRPTLDTARVASRIIGQLGLPDPEPTLRACSMATSPP